MADYQPLRRRATDALLDVPAALVISARTIVSVLVLLSVLLYQGLQSQFVNPNLLYPVYVVLSLASSLNLGLVMAWSVERFRARLLRVALYSDVLLVSGLIYFSGVHYSVFVFLYLLNLVASGLSMGRDEAMRVVLLTTLSFNFVYILGAELREQSLFFVIIFNNLAFFGVAWLSGYLHDQLHLLGGVVRARGREISHLKNLNKIIVSSVQAGLVLVDQDGILRYTNDRFLDVMGQRQSLLGVSLFKFLPKIAGRLGRSEHRENLSLQRIEYKRVEKGGDERLLELLISPVDANEAGFSGHLLIVQDITDLKKMEYSLRQSEKLAAIGQLAAGIAHEIRNPLASISGSIQLLKGLLASDKQDELKLMTIVIREIDRLNNLITEFLDYSRPDVRTQDRINLSELVPELMRLVSLNDRLPVGVQQVVSVSPDCIILGDEAKLKQALMNIMINAYQAMVTSAEKVLKVVVEKLDQEVVLTISDTGCGISSQGLTQIFEPFHTTKSQGTGLGLAITQKILTNHEAQIEVKSQMDHGTEFRLVFRSYDVAMALSV